MLLTAALACLLLAPVSRPSAPMHAQPRPAASALLLVGTVGRVSVPTGAAAEPGFALTTSDGTVYRIATGGSAKLLTANDALHGRPLRLTAQVVAGGGSVQVRKAQTVKGGKVFDVDYWCENCQMSYDEPGNCKCCMGETVLRERPVPALTPAPMLK